MHLSQTQFAPHTARLAEIGFAFRNALDTVNDHLNRRGPDANSDGWQEQEALRETALALVLLRSHDWPARGGIPALAQFTVHDATSPAFRASFCVPVPDLTPASLRAAFALCEARFTAASLNQTAPQSILQ